MPDPTVPTTQTIGRARCAGIGRAAACALVALSASALPGPARAQLAPLARLDASVLDVLPPAARVSGTPGSMRVAETACASPAAAGGNPRRRIVDLTVQEWAFFGFEVVDQTAPPAPRVDDGEPRTRRARRPWSWFDAEESARIADSIAGYWAATPDGAWIIDRQNGMWNGATGIGARWRDPWSAAFISWVMCESGFDGAEFRRAIAHHSYIDQAIRERDAPTGATAYVAYDVGETPIEPGDLLCSARRHGYETLADRRRHLGEGARSHCDIVVRVDADNDRILAIGGNVRGSVRLKLLYAPFDRTRPDAGLHVVVGHADRRVFAHLKLDAPPIEADALETTPTLRSVTSDGARAALTEALGLRFVPDET